MFSKLLGLFSLIAVFQYAVSVTMEEAEKNPRKGYVLTEPGFANQGVRIGPLDLSINRLEDLKKFDLDQALIDKFQPYLGVTSDNAVQLINEKPLELTQGELDSLIQKVKAFYKPKLEGAPMFIRNHPKVHIN